MSVKKAAAGNHPGSAQSVVERRAAEAQVRTIITTFAPAHLRLVLAMRRSLRKRLPAAHEVVYEYRDWSVVSFSPTGRGYEGVRAIRASALAAGRWSFARHRPRSLAAVPPPDIRSHHGGVGAN